MLQNNKAIVSIFLLVIFFFVSCKKENNPDAPSIEFSLAVHPSGTLKSALVSDIMSVVITIEDANGKVIKNSEKVELYNLDGDYLSQPVSLQSGSYKLTSFLVLDADDNVIYASPVKGSDNAYLVQESLPLTFSATNSVTKLVPQVIAVEGSTPESFGYSTFSLDVAETFDFMVGAYVYNNALKNFQLTDASIKISSETVLVYSGQINANSGFTKISQYDSVAVSNKITLPEQYTSFTLEISKSGFKTFSKTFRKDELKQYFRAVDKGPLLVYLEPETLEYYIRGNFAGEYVSYSMDTAYYYTNAHSLELKAYNDIRKASPYFSLALYGPNKPFYIDSISLPYTISKAKNDIAGIFEFIRDSSAVNTSTDTVNYFGIFGVSQNYPTDFTIVIEKITNDVIEGHFYGEINTSFEPIKTMPVTNGEFRAKFDRVTFDPWYYSNKKAMKTMKTMKTQSKVMK